MNQDLEKQASSVAERANAVLVVDQFSYDAAVEMLKGVKELRGMAETHHRPMIDAAHKSHKAALDALKKIDAPLAAAEATIKGKLGHFTAEQERKAAEERRRLEEEARRRREEEIEAELAAAEASGAAPAEVAAMIEQAERAPVFAPRPAVPEFRPAAGVSTRGRIEAKVTDFGALVRFVAANPRYQNLLAVNETALNQLARAQGEHMALPGVTVYKTATVAVRRGA